MYHKQIIQDSYEKNVRNASQAQAYQAQVPPQNIPQYPSQNVPQYPPQNVPQYPPQGDVYGRGQGKLHLKLYFSTKIL